MGTNYFDTQKKIVMGLSDSDLSLLESAINNIAYLCILRKEDVEVITGMFRSWLPFGAVVKLKCPHDLHFPYLFYCVPVSGARYEIRPAFDPNKRNPVPREVVFYNVNQWCLDSYSDFCKRILPASVPDAVSTPEHDPVKNPAHYSKGRIETWDFIRDQKLDYFAGNAIKYLSRAGSKEGAPLEQDLNKAKAYLQKALSNAEGITTPHTYTSVMQVMEYLVERELPEPRRGAIWCVCVGSYEAAIACIDAELNK